MTVVRYSDVAACDLREISRWYERRRKGRSRAFREDLNHLTDSLAANPERFAEDER